MPNPYFNAAYYLRTNIDVFTAGYTLETAEQHYDQYGANEAYLGGDNITPETLRKPAPWFDIQYYLNTYPDLLDNGVTPATAFHHFATYGIGEGRSPNQYTQLDAESLGLYAAGNPDLQEAFGIEDTDNLTPEQATALAQHFYQYGYLEDRPDLPNYINNQFTTLDGDELTGTNYNDTFVANADDGSPTLQSGDSVDALGGYNVLEIGAGAIEAEASPELLNIQQIVNSDVRGGPVYLDLENAPDVENVVTNFSGVVGAFAGAFYSHASEDTVFTLSNAQAQVEGAGRASIHVGSTGEDGKGGVENLNLVLDGNQEGSYYTANAGDGLVTSGTSTYDIEALAGNEGLILLNKFVEGVTVTGEGNFGLAQRAYDDLVNFNGTEASGDISIGNTVEGFTDLKLGDDFVIETGSGNDTIDLSTVETSGYIDAGAGDDTIAVSFDTAQEGSVWTLVGGEGADTFAVSGSSWGGPVEDLAVFITDFNAGDGDALQLGFGDEATTLVDETVIRNVVLNSQTAEEAIGKLIDEDAFADANVAVFEFGANTYTVYEAEVGDGFGLVQLTGTDLGLTADNIDGFATA